MVLAHIASSGSCHLLFGVLSTTWYPHPPAFHPDKVYLFSQSRALILVRIHRQTERTRETSPALIHNESMD